MARRITEAGFDERAAHHAAGDRHLVHERQAPVPEVRHSLALRREMGVDLGTQGFGERPAIRRDAEFEAIE